MSESQSERVFLVSGASRGLAHAVALALANQGVRVHGMARDSGRLAALARALGPDRVHGGDLRDPSVAHQVVQAVLAREGRLDGLILGVGTYHLATLQQTTATQWEDLLRTNLLSAVHLVDAARNALRETRGQVLMFGTAGMETRPARKGSAAYVVAKTALLAYMRSLALEEAHHGVRVNMLSPGIVPHAGASVDTLDPEVWKAIPLGRPGSLEDITDAALWMVQASHVTGQNLEVAGGFLL
ncbi:MAG: SDR family oxidoreductase [Planctomycetes bacterium]|nr:SDR family oxidoreductase [Planctomycetota bacterium]MCB9910129.1 SDR family oxidoreductase [Planctomycetota bacterium]MCB9913104.1 SDR family oxidoreductase [Planctomycetota bacterium]HPF13466.1 SDR family oxidoreductase [Planctomycetota bacterium]HRV81373.1 SDR family oxidoreductase [Planctomycetota bacterium]